MSTPDPVPDQTAAPGRRTFGPVVLLGLASSGLLALASTREWFRDSIQMPLMQGPGATDSAQAPLATALALVVLACWGVLLVTRGVVRRAVALLAAVAALGVAATIVDAWFRLPDQVGEPSSLSVGPQADPGWSGWFWTAAVCAVVALGAAGLALRFVRDWPEMGSRYDAPGGARPAEPVTGEQESGDLWRSIDEGHDPTA